MKNNSIMQKSGLYILTISSIYLLIASSLHWVEISLTEVLGFITGAVCVLLVVKQNIWNFPIGIANNVFFIILFFSSRLYGDMVLQVIYIILGVVGWNQWLHGGRNRSKLNISHISIKETLLLFMIGFLTTTVIYLYFQSIHDASPFLDALTTVLSLIAQYLLNGKRVENWYVWILVDVLYIGLYIQRGLYLTAILYAIFIVFCLVGLRAWNLNFRLSKEV